MSSSTLRNEVEDQKSSSSSSSGNNLCSSSFSSAEEIGRNHDICMEILLCLPLKSLLRFKLVSKHWLSLISDRHFANNHIRRNNSIPPPVGLFLNRKKSPGYDEIYHFLPFAAGGSPFKTLNFCDISQIFPYSFLAVTQSCNGLLCCNHYHTPSYTTTCVYNPSINQYKLIPTSLFRGDQGQLAHIVHSISLAFDPLKSPYYQVICIYVKEKIILSKEDSLPLGPNFHIEIYSSETCSWRLSGKPFQAPWGSFMSHGVFWNGSLHWFHRLFDDYDVHSFCFDIVREIVKPLPMPIIANDDLWDIEYFGECMGHLHLIVIVGPYPTGFDILEMQNDYSCWNFKYRVNLESLLMTYPEITRYSRIDIEHFQDLQVLCVKEENEESSLLLAVDGEKVISYDLKKMSFKKTHDLPTWRGEGPYWSSFPSIYVHQYIESLAHCA